MSDMKKDPHISAAERALDGVVGPEQADFAGAASLYRVELAKAHALLSIAKSLEGVDGSLDGIARYGLPDPD
jgi:hypothetical protein